MTLFIYKPHTFITRPCVCCLFLNRSSTWSMNNEPSMKIRSNTLPKKSNIIMSLCETLSIIYSYNRYIYIYTHIVHIYIYIYEKLWSNTSKTLEVAMMLGSSANGLVWRPPWFSGEKQPMMILLPAGHFFRGTRWKNHPCELGNVP